MTEKPALVETPSLPEFGSTTTVFDAYRRLGQEGRAAFYYRDDDHEYVIKAQDLLSQLYEGQDTASVRIRSSWPLSKALEITKPGVRVSVDRIPITEGRQPPVTIQPKDERAFVLMEGARRLGWVTTLNLFDPATKRLVYICARNHENPDPDHGTCYRCPAKIVRSEFRD